MKFTTIDLSVICDHDIRLYLMSSHHYCVKSSITGRFTSHSQISSICLLDSVASVKPCRQEVIVQHNSLYGVYFRVSQFTGNALVLLYFSLSMTVSVMNCICIGFYGFWINLLVISAAFVNNDELHHVEPVEED